MHFYTNHIIVIIFSLLIIVYVKKYRVWPNSGSVVSFCSFFECSPLSFLFFFSTIYKINWLYISVACVIKCDQSVLRSVRKCVERVAMYLCVCVCMRGRARVCRFVRGCGLTTATIRRTTCVWRRVWARGVARSRTRATLISSCNVIRRDRGRPSTRLDRRLEAPISLLLFVVWMCASVCDSVVCAIVNCFAPWREYQFYRAPSIEESAARILRLIREVESYLWVCMHWEYTPAHPGYGIFFLDYLNI